MTSILESDRPSFVTYELYSMVPKTQAFDVGSHKLRTVRKKYDLFDIFGPFFPLPILDYHTTNPTIPANKIGISYPSAHSTSPSAALSAKESV